MGLSLVDVVTLGAYQQTGPDLNIYFILQEIALGMPVSLSLVFYTQY